MPHPRLQTFFTGAVDELRGAYKKSEGAPSSSMGSLRENGIRRAIEHCLPGTVKLFAGEIIDPNNQTGQLDGIVVHASGAALATAPDDSRVVLAEGAIAVIESKSTLSSQWEQVVGTWDKLKKIRRYSTREVGACQLGEPKPGDDAVHFVVMGRTGWAKRETLEGKAVDLSKSFGSPNPPTVLVVQLDPPGFSSVHWDSTRKEHRASSVILPEEERYYTLVNVWYLLTTAAQKLMVQPPDWNGYLGDRGPTRETTVDAK